jgi:hypothetical protein
MHWQTQVVLMNSNLKLAESVEGVGKEKREHIFKMRLQFCTVMKKVQR